MILKALTIENFKGIREPVRIELAPLTLLFGSNNAGKSTIIHALIYAREIFERGNTDPRRTEMGGDLIDLGGFDNLVYGHDRKRSIRMRFELDIKAEDITASSPERSNTLDIDHESPKNIWIHKYFVLDTAPFLNEIIKDLKLDWIEIRIVWSENLQRPVVGSFFVGSSNTKQPCIAILYDHKAQQAYLTRLDLKEILLGKRHTPASCARARKIVTDDPTGDFQWLNHLSLSDLTGTLEVSSRLDRVMATKQPLYEERIGYCTLEELSNFAKEIYKKKAHLEQELAAREACRRDIESLMNEQWMSSTDLIESLLLPEYLSEDGSILPLALSDLDSALPISSYRIRLSACYKLISQFNQDKASFNQIDNERNKSDWKYPPLIKEIFFEPLLTGIVVGTSNCLRAILNNSLYLSSTRLTPERDFHPVQPLDVRRWVNGLAAWDVLVTEEPSFVSEVNHWLSGESLFATGYQIEIQAMKELDLASDIFEILSRSDDAFAIKRVRKALDRLPEVKKLRIRDIYRDVAVSPRDVGYGFSQLVPVLVAAIYNRSSIVAVEEPESNLHPALQVVLADLFITQAKANPEVLFLVETHSEHLMLRCLRRIRETTKGILPEGITTVTPEDIAVHFVERSPEGPRIRQIEIDEDGDFIDEWPGGFFEESYREKFAGR
jgi:predicted ATPase